MEQKKELPLIGWLAILAALVIGVILIFAGLEVVMPKEWKGQIWTTMQNKDGQDTVYDLRLLEKSDRQDKDIQAWLTRADEEGEDSAFWLCRKDKEEYVLYLPMQDRVLKGSDLTATDEEDEDGEIVLVLRARTGEKSGEIDPADQLFALQTRSERWRGIRVKVVLDGREKDVHKLVSTDNKLYSPEEVYIGRDIDE